MLVNEESWAGPRDVCTDDCSREQQIGRLGSGEGWNSCLFLPIKRV